MKINHVLGIMFSFLVSDAYLNGIILDSPCPVGFP